jgi:hypothetical protein
MEEMAPCWNNLPLLFLHFGVIPTGGIGEHVTWSSRRSLDPTRFMCGGRMLELTRVAVVATVVVMFDILQLGAWMTAYGDVPRLQQHQMKLTVSRSRDRGEDP